MIFFNSKKPKAFAEREQVELCLFSNLINMMIAGEMSALRAISATARIARSIAHVYNLSDEFIEQVHLFDEIGRAHV